MNKSQLIGRLTKDPLIRRTAREDGESVVAKFVLAVPRRYMKGKEPETDFISCTCAGKRAEFTERYLKKGMRVALSGSIQTGRYINDVGTTVYVTTVFAEEVEPLDRLEKRRDDLAEAEMAAAKEAIAPNEASLAAFEPAAYDEDFPFDFGQEA